MNDKQPGNPLHNITLKMILIQLVADYGWSELGRIIDIKCFKHEPSPYLAHFHDFRPFHANKLLI